MLLVLLSCNEPAPAVDDTGPAPDAPAMALVPLEDAALLRRLSLDLRGVTPTLAELEALEDGTSIDALTDTFLDDERLKERMVELFAERWLTRTDLFNLTTESFELDAEQEFSFERSIGEEAPRIAAHTIAEDLPWSTLVTADYTFADAMLEDIWPVEIIEESEAEWRMARYIDNRPAMGVLGTNGIWLRYDTSNANLNRHRAAALSRLFLCSDYLTRPVTFSSSGLLEDGSLETAIRTEPSCISCHATLDPLASLLFGFWWFDRYDTTELSYYHAEREQLGALYLGVQPGWFGQPVDSINDLGGIIAADPRFADCAVQTMAELLWQRSVTLEDFSTLDALEVDFVADGMPAGSLLTALLATEEYRAGDVTGEAERADAVATRRLLSNSQLVTAIADLTGFVWEWEGFSQLENDDIGYRILAGGIDGDTVTSRLQTPTIASLLVVKRLSQAAASMAVERDLLDGSDPVLLTRVDLDTREGDDAFDVQLTELYRRLYSTEPTDAEREADAALWEAVEAEDGPEAAWRSLLSTLLRDPTFWTY